MDQNQRNGTLRVRTAAFALPWLETITDLTAVPTLLEVNSIKCCFHEYNYMILGVTGLNAPGCIVNTSDIGMNLRFGGQYDMYEGKLVFSQVMDFIPWHTLRR